MQAATPAIKRKIALLPGDGIGPEVMKEAVKVLSQVERLHNRSKTSTTKVSFEFKEEFIGGAGYDMHGEHFGPHVKNLCRQSDAILFGSVGGPADAQHLPKWKDAEKNSVLGIRKEFGMGINIRPSKLFPGLSELSPLKNHVLEGPPAPGIDAPKRSVDLVIIRELLLLFVASTRAHIVRVYVLTPFPSHTHSQANCLEDATSENTRLRRTGNRRATLSTTTNLKSSPQ